jgi:hypothetical protein
VTSTCAAAERDRKTFAGCVFYTAEVDNVDSDAAMPMSFLVTNSGSAAATVTLEQAVGGGGWMATGAPSTIAGGTAARLSVAGFTVSGTGVKEAGALRVTSNQPVTVAQIQSDDGNNHVASSSAGTMVLPVHVLGQHYLVMTYPQIDTPAIDATPGGAGGLGRLLIVATQPGTHVTFRVSQSAMAVVAGTLATVVHDVPYEFDMGEGDVFQAWSGGDRQDLTGSEIVTNYPVAVFSGNITTTYGKTAIAPSINSPDMAHEQMPPVFAWSYKYVAAALPPQPGTCDTLLGKTGASVWRMLAVNANTRVDFVGPPGGDPPPPAIPRLAAGEVAEIIASGDFVVSASEPLLMTQGIDCEPSLSLAISADRLLDDLTFAVLPSFDHMIAVARLSGDQVLLDGLAIGDSMFRPAGAGYEVARVPLLPCPATEQVCTHRLQGRFGVTMRGMDVLASYALTAPAWSGCIDPLDCVM